MIDRRATMVLIANRESGAWEDRTADIAWVETRDGKVGVRFARGPKTYWYGAERTCVLTSPRTVAVPAHARLRVRGDLCREEDVELLEFGAPPSAWRLIVRHPGPGEWMTGHPGDDVDVVLDTASHGLPRDVMSYWRGIVATRGSEDPIVSLYDGLSFVDPDSVLATHLTGQPPRQRDVPDSLVFPFATNLSQRGAVRQALGSSLSIIEGPPGTGKTETILNLIANVVVGDLGSVGVVSFSNSAVDNVADKLKDRGLGHVIAHLGNRAKLTDFLAARRERDADAESFARRAPTEAPAPSELDALSKRLTDVLGLARQRAELRESIDAHRVELRQFERHLGAETLPDLTNLPLLSRSSERIIEYLAETQTDLHRGPPGVLRRLRRRLRYGATGQIDPADVQAVLALQAAFYDRRIAELESELAAAERALDGADAEKLMRDYRETSEQALAAAVAGRWQERSDSLRGGYLPQDAAGFRALIRDYPVIISTCHSLRRRIPDGYLLDYLIIDEASQVDLLAAVLAMASCRNLVVVGDRRQLPHIADNPPPDLVAPAPAYDWAKHSVLTSLTALYGDRVPTTLLREHYRSHPAIIGFCNAAFYDGKLIPFTESEGRSEPAMWVQPTALGNHMRPHHEGGRTNQREIEVIEREVLARAPASIRPADIAVAAPYRAQVKKATKSLGVVTGMIDTVHSLQGRQTRMVVLTTVLSDTAAGRVGLRFVDDPRMVNVAVSRAVDHFVLVTEHDKLPASRYLRDLIGYIEYRYPAEQPEPSRVVSVFDLLYKEYDDALRPIARRLPGTAGSPAEQILQSVLEPLLDVPEYAHLHARPQIMLRNLVRDSRTLSDEERGFVQRRSSVDFVIYNRVTRQPVLAIEVDGFAFHEDNPQQWGRDELKASILERIGLPLLRLPTTGSAEERRIHDALARVERTASYTRA